jgi:hypothetical protein
VKSAIGAIISFHLNVFSARNGLQSPPQMELQTFNPARKSWAFSCLRWMDALRQYWTGSTRNGANRNSSAAIVIKFWWMLHNPRLFGESHRFNQRSES